MSPGVGVASEDAVVAGVTLSAASDGLCSHTSPDQEGPPDRTDSVGWALIWGDTNPPAPLMALKPARRDLAPPTTAPATALDAEAVSPVPTPLTCACAASPLGAAPGVGPSPRPPKPMKPSGPPFPPHVQHRRPADPDYTALVGQLGRRSGEETRKGGDAPDTWLVGAALARSHASLGASVMWFSS